MDLSRKVADFAQEVGIEVPEAVINNTFRSEANRMVDELSHHRRSERKPDKAENKVENKPSSYRHDPYDEFLMSQMAHESGIGESAIRFLTIEDIAGGIEST